MRRRSRIWLTLRHYFGLGPYCPHPQHRIVQLRNERWRCEECWITYNAPDFDAVDEEISW